ncbi:MAG TPA: DUF1178 family protein [Gammaproteobacteria bacterium]|nr:DUF1178 family protein [Gammaproteobacteria bacterium]
MIVYDLLCNQGHDFEGWFDDARDYEKQLGSGILQCPVCGSAEVRKVPSASRLNLKRPDANQQEGRRRQKLLQMVQEHVKRNYEDVGSRFAEEARKMHYGERERRNIRGAASWAEFKELRREGIEAMPLPLHSPSKDKLN